MPIFAASSFAASFEASDASETFAASFEASDASETFESFDFFAFSAAPDGSDAFTARASSRDFSAARVASSRLSDTRRNFSSATGSGEMMRFPMAPAEAVYSGASSTSTASRALASLLVRPRLLCVRAKAPSPPSRAGSGRPTKTA